jgi:hypothetical protein
VKIAVLFLITICLTGTCLCPGSDFFFIGDKKGDEIYAPGQVEEGPGEPQKVTDRDLEIWRKHRIENFRDKGWFARFGGVIKKYKKSIYDRKPLDTKGNTIVRIEVEGYGLTITKHFVFLGVTDEEENPLLRVMKRSEKESEKESLQRFVR